MFGAVKVSGGKEKPKKEKKSKHRHHHHHEREEAVNHESRDGEDGLRDSQSSRSEEPAKRDEWMTGSGDPSSDRLAAMFEIGKMAVPRMERKAAERRAERERLMKESNKRMNKIDLANDEGLSERAHLSEKAREAHPWALPESCLVNSGGRRWHARAARRRRESDRDSGPSEASSRSSRERRNDDDDRRERRGRRGERDDKRRGWGRSRSRSSERRGTSRSSREELASLADKYNSRRSDREAAERTGERAQPSAAQVDASSLDANELSAAAMRAMLAGDMAEYERLNSLMATKTVVVDEQQGQGALGSAKPSRAKMLSVREDSKDEDSMDVSELLRQERASRGVRGGEYDRHLAENIRKNKRFQGSAEEDEYFGATEVGGGGENPEQSMPAELMKEKRRKFRGTGWMSEDKRRKDERDERRAARRTQRECDLCMENSSWSRNREDKLIAASPRVYICMANYKSTLLRGQFILVPQNHCASLRTADEETAEEIRNYQKCLAHFYATMDPPCVPVFIETVKSPPQNDDIMALLGGGAHTTMQCFPVPQDRIKELESYFRQGMSLAGDTWSNQPKIVECKGRSDVSSSGIPPSSPYMHVDFGLQVGLVHIIDKAKEFRWDYGLQTIAGMLEIDKLSLVHYDQPGAGGEQKYEEDVEAFKGSFKAYDWAQSLA